MFWKSELLEVYYSLLSTVVDYASPLFLTANGKINSSVDRCIRRAHKVICGPSCPTSCITDIETRRIKQ